MFDYLFLRLAVMGIGALLGWELGLRVSPLILRGAPRLAAVMPSLSAILGALVGLLISPWAAIRPYRNYRKHVRQLGTRQLVLWLVGMFVGLVLAALLAAPLSRLPGAWGQWLPLVVAFILGVLGVKTAAQRGTDCLSLLGLDLPEEGDASVRSRVLLDTSVIIDGRIDDIRQTGFVPGTMIVPQFVLDELQHIADSADALRRNRGRRGLDVLNRMRKDERMPLEILARDVSEASEVDGKLVRLARDLNCPILTNDYNLNRVAELQGVQVLNINELANAVKVVVLPGETLRVQIIQEGKELGQGVGYLDDGTMIVIEDGRRHMGKTVELVVTRVLQTVAGRMIFGQIPNGHR